MINSPFKLLEELLAGITLISKNMEVIQMVKKPVHFFKMALLFTVGCKKQASSIKFSPAGSRRSPQKCPAKE